MKKVYQAPNAETFRFDTVDVLAASGELPLVKDEDKGGSSTEIGQIPLF